MLIVFLINLIWLFIDSLFAISIINNYFIGNFQSIYNVYSPIHSNFLFYDFIFVFIYLIEFSLRLLLSVKNKNYEKWYMYLLVHWYDIIGCLPLTTFRFCRLFRIITIVVRLHKLERIDITKFYIYRWWIKTTDIILEELSDRMLIIVLNRMKNGITTGNYIFNYILTDIISPQKDKIIDLISQFIQEYVKRNNLADKQTIKKYIHNNLKEHIDIPVLGYKVEKVIYDIVTFITYIVITNLNNIDYSNIVKETTNDFIDFFAGEDSNFNQLIMTIILESINIVKERIAIQQWKLN